MKGFLPVLPVLFFCVTLYLADGYLFLLHDHGDESEAHMYRSDWNPFRENMLKQLEQDMNDGKKGPVTILGQALLETILLLLDDSPKFRSAEGQRRSDLSDLDSRDSSVSPRSGSARENKYITPGSMSNSAPVFGMIISRNSQENVANKTNEKCFVRQILDLISLLVTNANDEDARKSGVQPTGPKMLHLLVNELHEGLESLNNIEVLDTALFQIFELIRRLLKGVKLDLPSVTGPSPEVDSIVKFIGKIESFFDNYIEKDKKMAAEGKSVPAIRLLLEEVERSLNELSEGKSLTNGTEANSLDAVRKLIGELKSTLKILILAKWDNKSESSLFMQLLYSTERVVGQIVEEMKALEHEPGSLNNLILSVLMFIRLQLVEILIIVLPQKRER